MSPAAQYGEDAYCALRPPTQVITQAQVQQGLRYDRGMPNYRRLFQPDGTWFFTATLLDRDSSLLVEKIENLQDAIQKTQNRFPFEIDAQVILPEHIHAIWTLPSGDTDFSVRWRQIKSRFSKDLPKTEFLTATRVRRGERGIWERRFWEHLIRDERDLRNHLNYCWFNPLTHGLDERVEDWPYSTFHRDWADWPKPGDFEAAQIEYGERGG